MKYTCKDCCYFRKYEGHISDGECMVSFPLPLYDASLKVVRFNTRPEVKVDDYCSHLTPDYEIENTMLSVGLDE